MDGETVRSFETKPPSTRGRPRPWRLPLVRHQVQRWMVPLSVGGRPVFGLLTFSLWCAKRDAGRKQSSRGVKLIAQVFACTLSPRGGRKGFTRKGSPLELGNQCSRSGPVEHEPRYTKRCGLEAKTRRLFDFPPDEELTYQSFRAVIHPEDRRAGQRGGRADSPVRKEPSDRLPDHTPRRWHSLDSLARATIPQHGTDSADRRVAGCHGAQAG